MRPSNSVGAPSHRSVPYRFVNVARSVVSYTANGLSAIASSLLPNITNCWPRWFVCPADAVPKSTGVHAVPSAECSNCGTNVEGLYFQKTTLPPSAHIFSNPKAVAKSGSTLAAPPSSTLVASDESGPTEHSIECCQITVGIGHGGRLGLNTLRRNLHCVKLGRWLHSNPARTLE